MSSVGKKGKKKKSKTVDLNTFLADGGTTPTVSVKLSSWNEEMEEEHEGYLSRSSKEPVVLPTAPRAARGPRIADEDIPTNPPYVAYLSNLPYEVDESYLTEFFADMKIASIRLPKDSTKLKGYGYVEFEDRQSLVDALCLSNTPMKTRRVRIDLSNNVNDERRGGRMGRDNRRDNYDDPERTSGDWRSGPRDETPSDGDSYRPRYDNRDRRDDRESSDNDNKPGAWRESSERGRPTFRDRAGFREDERDRDWSRYDRGSRDREGDRGNSFGQRRNYGDSDREWDRDGPRRQGKPTAENVAGEPRTRPKLQLQPRTKPIEPIAAKEEQQQQSASGPTPASGPAPASGPVPASASAPTPTPTPAPAPAPAPASSTNIFGAAKPVDTTAREREIEERLAKSYAESKSKEDGDSEKRGPKEGAWGRRNGEGRDEKERSRAWRTEDNSRRNEISAPQNQASHSDQYGDSKPSSRGGRPSSRGPPKSNDARGDRDKDRRDREKDDVSKMPKAKDEQTPNFAASNKYSMLPNDVDPDNDD